MKIDKFTINDIINKYLLEKDSNDESYRINEEEKKKENPRTLEQIKFFYKMGKVAEHYLAQEFKHLSLSNNNYHDLWDSNEKCYVEVKAYSQKNIDNDLVKKHINRIKNAKWNKSKYLLLFMVKNDIYEFIKRYDI